MPSLLLAFPQKSRYTPENNSADLTAHRFKSISLQLEQGVARQHLEAFLSELLQTYSEQLVRLKGVAYTLEQPELLII